jgi:hypothetical protein
VSLFSSRVGLIHRCNVLRSDAGKDPWQQPDVPDFSGDPHIANLNCRGYVNTGRQAIDVSPDGSSVRNAAVIEDRRLIVPLGTDIKENDQIDAVTYRGMEILDGPMLVQVVLSQTDSLEVLLKRVK